MNRVPMPAPPPFPTFAEAVDRPYDVLIIGGGINGAGIAREAALRGRSVLLVEKHDYGWGTTWRSTKLIHGGLRYLEHGEIGLVFESLRDQATLLRAYPDMVRPIELLLPAFLGDRHRPFVLDLGLTLYDALALGRRLPRHRRISPGEATRLEPGLRRAGLRAAFRYYDCQVAYPERLCLQTLQEARLAGAAAISRATVVTPLVDGRGRICGARVRDEESGAVADVRAAVVVNAAGPWVDAALRGLPRPPARQIGGTRGTHIVVDYHGRGPRRALYAEATADHRPFFIVPWRGMHLVGTTDIPCTEPPDDARATPEEIAYLLTEANNLLPHTPLAETDIAYAYAGVRPLPTTNARDPGAITRRHIVRDHAGEGLPGLISIIGGKLSTFRSLANAAAATIDRYLAATPRHSPGELPFVRNPALVAMEELPPQTADYLRSLYGPSVAPLMALLREQPELRAPVCEHGPDVRGQIVFAARHEGARGLSDVLLRRTGVGWNRCLGLHCAAEAADLLGRELGWTEDRIAREIDAYRREVIATFTVPAHAESVGQAAG
jgi:glycerol-3-phosphate dehydrogenase